MFAIVLAVLAQDPVDNYEYKPWASFKVGSSVTFKVEQPGREETFEHTVTLKSLGDNELVVETVVSLKGKAVGRPTARKITAKLAAEDAPRRLREGDEEIAAGGRKLKCRWTEYEKKLANGKTLTMKIWSHEDVPGGQVRIELTSEGKSAGTMTATAWEKKP